VVEIEGVDMAEVERVLGQ